MIKRILVIIVVCSVASLLTLFVFGLFGSHDFRNTNWGMTSKQVKALEKDTFIETEVLHRELIIYAYSTSVDSVPARLEYAFYLDKLISATYYIGEEDALTPKEKIKAYYEYKKEITEKYGEPFHAFDESDPERNKSDLDVLTGKTINVSEWTVGDTESAVSLILDTEENITRLRVMHFTFNKTLRIPPNKFSDIL